MQKEIQFPNKFISFKVKIHKNRIKKKIPKT